MKRTVFTFLYLMAATTAVFYWPRIMASFGNSESETPGTLAEEARMDETAYFALREVASVQLGYVIISYELDEKSGHIKKHFTNAVCPSPQSDPDQVLADQKIQSRVLHKQILSLRPQADQDGSGFVSGDEGSQYKDLYESGHLAAHCFGQIFFCCVVP